jgi:uncharacterized MAPEG superfamily protein
MRPEMKQELVWLTYTAVMTGLFWVPYILNRLKEMGPIKAVCDSNANMTPRAKWADRMMRAHRNAVENLVVFAPLVLALQVVGISTPVTVMACKVYFLARLVHFIVYTAGVPVVRTLSFAVGFACQMALAYVLLKGG